MPEVQEEVMTTAIEPKTHRLEDEMLRAIDSQVKQFADYQRARLVKEYGELLSKELSKVASSVAVNVIGRVSCMQLGTEFVIKIDTSGVKL
jgi:hypothetical protein